MQAQAYEGYIEGGQFYPKEIPIHQAGRYRAILTVLDIPVQEDASTDWVDELVSMVKDDTSEKLCIEDFPRMDFGRTPIVFHDKGKRL